MMATRVLVVEDERIVAEDLRGTLEDLGYTVTSTVGSGAEAIARAAREAPDVVLMDIVLQGEIDGIQAADTIRMKHRVPVVYVTAHADAGTLDRAKVTEPYGYILKPFENRELQTAIEIALYKRKAEGRIAHLTAILRAIRNVNQFLVKEKDRDRLLTGVCEHLIETRGYRAAWIVLVDDANRVRVGAMAGGGEDFERLPEALAHGDLAEYGRQVLAAPDIVRVEQAVLARIAGHTPCTEDGNVSLLARLESFGTVYGFLGVVLPADMLEEAEELPLFREVTGDVAFALHALGVEEERRAAEAALAARTRQLEAVRSVSAEITRELRLPALLDLIGRRAAELVHADSGTVRLWDEEAQLLVPVAWSGLGGWIGNRRLRKGEGLSGRVAERREGVIVNDYRTSAYASPEVLERTAIIGIVAEPLLYRDRLLGVLTADNTGKRPPFTVEDRQTLALFASQAAVAIENARLFEAVLRQSTEREALLQASKAIESSLDLDQVLQAIVQQAAEISAAPIVRLFLLDDDKQLLRCRVSVGFPLDADREMVIPVEGTLSGQVAAKGKPLAVADTREDSRTYFPGHIAQYGVVSYLGLPVKFQTRLFGVLVFNTPVPRHYDRDEITFLAAFAQQAALAIQNARLYADARHELTERRQAEERLARLNDCLLSFGPDPIANIDRLVALCGAQLRASYALYSRLKDGKRCTWEQWNVPASQAPEDRPEGHICEDLIRKTPSEVWVLRHLLQTPYAQSNPSISRCGLQTYVGRTVSIGGGPVGSLCLLYQDDYSPSQEELRLVGIVASAIAVEEQRFEAVSALRTQTQQLDAIRAIGTEITRELDLGNVLQIVSQRLSDLVGRGRGGVCLWHDGVQALIPHTHYRADDPNPAVRVELGEGVAGRVAQAREGMIVNDYQGWSGVPLEVRARTPVAAVMAEPLLYRDKLVGVLHVDTGDPGATFSEQEQAVLRLFASQAAIAIENARLFAAVNQSFQDLQQAQDALIQGEKLRALGQMAAGVAHDLNNMLAAILGQAELIRLRATDPAIHEALQILYTAASDGAQVVRRLQGFGRHRADTPLVPCDLATLTNEALELTRPRWQDEVQRENRLIEVWSAVENLPQVLGNPAEIREALTNLILNAVDAMATGGTLTIAGYVDPPEARPEAAQVVVITLTDTGVGMSEDVRHRIFDPFFTTKGFKGTGLGLAVVYGIMERHGGKIEVVSTPGQGTTFVLRFQAAPKVQPTIPPEAQAPRAVQRKLLVIDDETTVRQSIANLLRAVGHTVIEAESGAEGLALLADDQVDLVITDLGMPGMTGWEVAQRVKEATPQVPVVLLTGWGQHLPDAAPARSAVDRVLAKPIGLEALQRVVADLTAPRADARSG